MHALELTRPAPADVRPRPDSRDDARGKTRPDTATPPAPAAGNPASREPEWQGQWALLRFL